MSLFGALTGNTNGEAGKRQGGGGRVEGGKKWPVGPAMFFGTLTEGLGMGDPTESDTGDGGVVAEVPEEAGAPGSYSTATLSGMAPSQPP